MGTLYLDRKDLELRQEGEHLSLYEDGSRRGTIPLHVVERVVIRGRATLSTGVLGLLAERRIGLLVLSGRHSRRTAILLGTPHGDVARRVAQYRWHHEAANRLPLARLLVQAKLRSQRQMLKLAMAQRADCRKPLFNSLAQIEAALTKLRTDDAAELSLASLRGAEGAAAAAYFSGLISIFPPSLEFSGRNRRPPRDPVNAAMSLAYTLLHFDAVQTCHAAGLDPFIGFFHDVAYNRESLAADLIEPLRARVDHWLWRLFAERKLTNEHFSREGGACLLNKSGREIFYGNYEVFCRPVRRLMRRYAGTLARILASELTA